MEYQQSNAFVKKFDVQEYGLEEYRIMNVETYDW